jgi:small-conductance mechanosensitive channel
VEIGWRSTKVRLRDDDYAVIPNQQCTASQLVNLTTPKSTHLISFDFPVKHTVEMDKLRKSLVKLAAGAPGVVNDPPVELLAVAIKTDHLVLRLRFWIEDLLKKDQAQSEIIERTFKKLAEDGLLPESDSK